MIGQCYRRHRQQEFVRFVEEIDAALPHAEGGTIHWVMDNYGPHKTPRVKRWLQRHPRYVVHFTPASASWLNQVERFFAQLTEKRIRRGVFRSVAALEAVIKDYLEKHNQDPKPFVGTATADLIFKKVQNSGARLRRLPAGLHPLRPGEEGHHALRRGGAGTALGRGEVLVEYLGKDR